VLGEVKVDEKSNEITATPKLLQLLDITGCLVTIDAMGTQTEIAEQIIDQGGDYLFAVTENQAKLYEDLEILFSGDQTEGFTHTGCTHARKVGGKSRSHRNSGMLGHFGGGLPTFCTGREGLRTLAMIVSERRLKEKTEIKTRYYISSRALDAKAFLKAKRSHWGIENGLHWVSDIAFDEDHCRVRKDLAPEKFAILPHLALNKLKHETTVKAGIHAKRMKAGWDEKYLLKVLSV
jgi:predicted transposase YbfD/YdcC